MNYVNSSKICIKSQWKKNGVIPHCFLCGMYYEDINKLKEELRPVNGEYICSLCSYFYLKK